MFSSSCRTLKCARALPLGLLTWHHLDQGEEGGVVGYKAGGKQECCIFAMEVGQLLLQVHVELAGARNIPGSTSSGPVLLHGLPVENKIPITPGKKKKDIIEFTVNCGLACTMWQPISQKQTKMKKTILSLKNQTLPHFNCVPFGNIERNAHLIVSVNPMGSITSSIFCYKDFNWLVVDIKITSSRNVHDAILRYYTG